MNIFNKLWRAEPVIAGIVGNALFLPSVIYGASALGHPISPDAQKALIGLSTVLTGVSVRQTVTAPDTLAQQIRDVVSAQR